MPFSLVGFVFVVSAFRTKRCETAPKVSVDCQSSYALMRPNHRF